MTKVLVNGAESGIAASAQTLGELLEILDREYQGHGVGVTAIRLDGVEEPALRDLSLAPTPLSTFQVVDVETTKLDELARSALDEASVAVDILGNAADRLGVAFRGADLAAANRDLVEFAVGLGSLVAMTSTVATATAFDMYQGKERDESAIDMIDELSARTDALISAQQVGDWVTVADVIEYDISSSLRRWPAVLATMREAVPAMSASGL